MKSENTHGNPNHDEQGRFTSGSGGNGGNSQQSQQKDLDKLQAKGNKFKESNTGSFSSERDSQQADKLFGIDSSKKSTPKYTNKRSNEYDKVLNNVENALNSGNFDKDKVGAQLDRLYESIAWDVDSGLDIPSNEARDIEDRIHDLKNSFYKNINNKEQTLEEELDELDKKQPGFKKKYLEAMQNPEFQHVLFKVDKMLKETEGMSDEELDAWYDHQHATGWDGKEKEWQEAKKLYNGGNK